MDRENSSFLFNLKDQFVHDAYWWKGYKLKFANQSRDPSCYPKVIMAAGITELVYLPKKEFVQERKLFYDYHYQPDTTPAWDRRGALL